MDDEMIPGAYRDAANVLAQRGGHPQSVRVYGSYTNAANWWRLWPREPGVIDLEQQPERICVRCGVRFELVTVPCPDGLAGPGGFTCAVQHYGLRCPTCGGAVYEAR
jgi:hypothetical protein